MATGRTVDRWTRVYVDGYDFSGQARSIGPLSLELAEAKLTTLADTVHGYLPNHPQVNVGALNAVFDNTATTGIHNVLATAGGKRTVLVAKGIQGVPAAGDPAFGGVFMQKDYTAADDGGALVLNLPFSGWAADADSLLYGTPWGTLLHALGAEMGSSTDTGFDNPTEGATAKGGFFIYHVTAGNGTATLKVQDAASNVHVSFGDLTGATSGVIDCSTRQHGLVAIGNTAAVKRYLRSQIVLGTATTVTFASAFMRAF